MNSRDYWNENLDTDNLSRKDGSRHVQLSESLAFADTPEFQWLVHRAGNVEGKTLIDIGGGIGLQSILWARLGANVIVIDMAEQRLGELRHVAREAEVENKIRLLAGKAEKIPLGNASVDIAFTKSVLIHTDLPRAAKEIHRVLKPGGQGLFIEPTTGNPLIRLYRRFLAPRIWRSITRYFDDESRRELREPFGGVMYCKYFYLLSAWSFFWQYARRNIARFNLSLRRWIRYDRKIMRKYPKLERWCWFVSMEVRKTIQYQNKE